MRNEIPFSDIFHKSKAYVEWLGLKLGMKLPFSKLDHIFLPDLHSISTTNAGGITFDDKYLQNNMNAYDYEYFNMLMAKGM